MEGGLVARSAIIGLTSSSKLALNGFRDEEAVDCTNGELGDSCAVETEEGEALHAGDEG